MQFKPLSNHVFLEPLEEEKVTKTGIVLPDTAEKQKPMQGRVVAVGPGKMNEKGDIVPMAMKIGDVVLFKKYGPDEIELDGKKYLVGDEDDILAIVVSD
jgi:chaperonin GroES